MVMNDPEREVVEESKVESEVEEKSDLGPRAWRGKGIALEKDEAGLRLCILPAGPGAEPQCFASPSATDEDADALAELLLQLGALDP